MARFESRKRPRQARSQVTLDAILEASVRVLRARDFDGASTTEIARVAGVSVGSVYQYFPNKEALFGALIDRHAQRVMAGLAEIASALADAPLPTLFRALIARYVEVERADVDLHKVLARHVGRLDRDELVAELEDRMIASLEAIVAGREGLRVRDLGLAARIVVRSLRAVVHRTTEREPERLLDDRFVDELATMVIRYVCEP